MSLKLPTTSLALYISPSVHTPVPLSRWQRIPTHEDAVRVRPEDLRNLDDGWSRAMEMVATPVIFALLGFLLDRWLGTTPLFTIVLAVFALIGSAAATWYRYDASMREHETEMAQRRGGSGAAEASAQADGNGARA